MQDITPRTVYIQNCAVFWQDTELTARGRKGERAWAGRGHGPAPAGARAECPGRRRPRQALAQECGVGRSPLATTGVQAPSWGWELPRGACSGRWWVALGAAHGLRHSKGLRLQLEPRTRDVTTIRTQWPLAHPFIQTQATQSFCRTTRNALRCFWCALSRPPRPIPEAAPGPPPPRVGAGSTGGLGFNRRRSSEPCLGARGTGSVTARAGTR